MQVCTARRPGMGAHQEHAEPTSTAELLSFPGTEGEG